jgi:hypothetical protein
MQSDGFQYIFRSSRLMNGIFPIAAFEHMQMHNWVNGNPEQSAYDICDNIVPVQNFLSDCAKKQQVKLTTEFIFETNERLVNCVNGTNAASFIRSEEWLKFIFEIEEACSPDPIETYGCGAWIMAQLYWCHLSTLRLLTSWLIVDALGQQERSPRPVIHLKELGTFLEHLCMSGPPLFDAESLRGKTLRYL